MSRLETGPYRHTEDDWQGLFIRGDDCAYLAMCVEAALEGTNDVFTDEALKGLLNMLRETRE